MTLPEKTPAGRLKIFLGYAAEELGKTYQMLDEAQQLRRKGVDVVIGYFEPHARRGRPSRAHRRPGMRASQEVRIPRLPV